MAPLAVEIRCYYNTGLLSGAFFFRLDLPEIDWVFFIR